MSQLPPGSQWRERLEGIAATTALVLETNNLRGGKDALEALNSLERLIARLARQSLSPQSFAQWVITHDGLDLAARQALCVLAGRTVDFVEIDASTGYYDAKNVGFDAVDQERCQYVVFADADCQPDARWLEQLLVPFAAADAPVAVAGRTSYAPSVAGSALTAIDFMYFPSPLRHGATRNFYANNVAFRCATFEQYRYEPWMASTVPTVRSWACACQAAGVAVAYAPARIPSTACPTARAKITDAHRELTTAKAHRG